MENNQSLDTTLVSVAIFLGSVLPTVFASNFWFGIIDAVVIVGIVALYHKLP